MTEKSKRELRQDISYTERLHEVERKEGRGFYPPNLESKPGLNLSLHPFLSPLFLPHFSFHSFPYFIPLSALYFSF